MCANRILILPTYNKILFHFDYVAHTWDWDWNERQILKYTKTSLLRQLSSPRNTKIREIEKKYKNMFRIFTFNTPLCSRHVFAHLLLVHQ